MRNGAELLDRLLKDTVTENSGNEKFDIVVFMQLLRERIYVKNSYVRQFLVSWVISFLKGLFSFFFPSRHLIKSTRFRLDD